MEKTLLQEFLINRFKNYVEPQRKGTPKGDPIGFSKEKYGASLFMLYDKKQKETANIFNISYGLLRKWNTEKVFKDAVTKHCIEYAEYLLTYLREKNKQLLRHEDEILKKPLNEIATHTRPQWDYNEFSDYKYYNLKLKEIITIFFSNAVDKAIKENDMSFSMTIYNAIEAFRIFSGANKTNTEKEEEKRLSKILEKSMLEDVKNILLKNTITKDDRKRAVAILALLEQTKK